MLTSAQQLGKLPSRYNDLVRLIVENKNRFQTIGELDYDRAIEVIADVLNIVYKATDNRTELDQEQMRKSMEFIRYSYPTLHPYEIEFAYDLHMAKIITVEFVGASLLQKNIANVMTVYCRYRAVQVAAVKKPVQDISVQPTLLQIRQINLEFINTVCNLYENYQSGGKLYDHYLVSSGYDLLKKNGLIEEGLEEELKEDATQAIKGRNRGAKSKHDVVVEKTSQWDNEMKIEIKKLAFTHTFYHLKTSKFDLRNDLIKKLK